MRKSIQTFILLFSLTIFSCETEDQLSESEIREKQTEVTNEIIEIINLSNAENSSDCRTRFVGGGDNCSDPVFAYGILDIDTVLLDDLFTELAEIKEEIASLNTASCDVEWEIPNNSSLINGVCTACYGIGEEEICY